MGKITSAPIISHKRKYIYVYVPKVACSTIREMLAKIDGVPYYPNWTFKNGKKLVTRFKRVRIPDITKFNNYFKFMFVRNPWDRLVSCYLEKVVSVRNMANSPWVDNGIYRAFKSNYGKNFKTMTFDQFVEFVSCVPDKDADGHFRSQHTYVGNQLNNINFIGKFEKLDEDLDKVKHTLMIDYDHKHILKSKNRKPYKEYYTVKTKKLVLNRFLTDIKLFNYTF